MQSQLNNQALSYVPKIKQILKTCDQFSHDQIINYTLREMNNRPVCLTDSSFEEIDKFQDELIEIFKINDWIK